jgi:Rad3-related DNA helicase
VAEQIANGITGKARVFLHDRNTKLNDLIAEFKNYTKSAVLISPSIFEGLDFAGDNSRFQILLKAPYPSLGEKRMKHIADNYGEIYRLMTLKKIIQGIGRSVRSEDDYATTYVLDANIKKLFNSSLNVWKDQFEVE